ncbi:MAG: hypothetical protein ABR577_08690 [Pyrinomonadaceae bacterium]
MAVHNETTHLYRYWDATDFFKYLYECVAEAIRRDLKEELGFLSAFDKDAAAFDFCGRIENNRMGFHFSRLLNADDLRCRSYQHHLEPNETDGV